MIEYCEVCKKDVELLGHLCPYCGRTLFARKNRVRYGTVRTADMTKPKKTKDI
jgi:predicted RNA-binding Zn-ribbon protein involved in translation (DUF1610 family)